MLFAALNLTETTRSVTGYVLANPGMFASVLKGAGDLVGPLAAGVESPIRRVGSAIVFGSVASGRKVLGFIEQAVPSLELIGQSVASIQSSQAVMSTALGGLAQGQQAILASLAGLGGISMMTLGFAALTPAVLIAQFQALHGRLDELSKLLKGLHTKFDADRVATLKAAVDLIDNGIRCQNTNRQDDARHHLNAAYRDCLRLANYYETLLLTELNTKTPNRDEVRVMARHLAVATTGVASCHIALGDDTQAIEQLRAKLPALQKAAGWVFHQTAGKEPVRFLDTPLGEKRVGLRFMAELFHSASDAGIVEPKEDMSSVSWFETHKDNIFGLNSLRPMFYRDAYFAALQADLLEGVSAVEEVNRVRSLEQTLVEVRDKHGSNRETMAEVQAKLKESGASAGEHVVWTLSDK